MCRGQLNLWSLYLLSAWSCTNVNHVVCHQIARSKPTQCLKANFINNFYRYLPLLNALVCENCPMKGVYGKPSTDCCQFSLIVYETLFLWYCIYVTMAWRHKTSMILYLQGEKWIRSRWYQPANGAHLERVELHQSWVYINQSLQQQSIMT